MPPQSSRSCTCLTGTIQPACLAGCPIARDLIAQAARNICRARRVPQAEDDVEQEMQVYLVKRGEPFPRNFVSKLAWYKLRDWMKSSGGGALWHPLGKTVSVDEPGQDLPDPEPDEDAGEVVEALLADLPEHERLVVAMRHGVLGYPEMGFDEIAIEMTRITSQRWSRARVTMTYGNAMKRILLMRKP